MKRTLLALAAVAILGVACKKETTDDGGGQTMPPSELIVGKWFGDEQSLMVSVTGSGPLDIDTSFTQTEDLSWIRLTFNSDGTGQLDSLGMDVEALSWMIHNNDLLVLDGLDTLMITTLTSSDLHLSQSEVDNTSLPPAVIETSSTIKFTK